MSQQQFADPEQNFDPQQYEVGYQQQQEQAQEGPRQEDVPWSDEAMFQQRGQKLQPQAERPRKKSNKVWLWVLVGFIFPMMMAFGGMFYYAARTIPGIHVSPDGFPGGHVAMTQDFQVSSGQVHLIINDPTGTIHINADSGTNTVNVRDTNAPFGRGNRPGSQPVQFVQNGNTITITVNNRSMNDDLTIDTPVNTDVQSNKDFGQVDIGGVHGNVTVHDNIGDVFLHDVSGTVNASTNAGKIEADNTHLSGNSVLKSDNGSVSFQGDLDPHGTYDFETNNGSVDLTLPENSSFHINANSNAGGNLNNEFGGTTVGSNPSADVTVRTGVGDITISKGN